ncbi:hypothetical protein HAP93_10910 [Acidithiobacillus ferriphilus]|uniref:hypothetical protein n=1 Tax=Acidithiobacillus ferriphilus TaxID=1689834 RepID=UPI001C061AF5|nr:hypothetical protein [Acidithiobacillus ferriphilus]MBU2786264.1 hypothetical protein [Acidithiobacillus ferriphilus]
MPNIKVHSPDLPAGLTARSNRAGTLRSLAMAAYNAKMPIRSILIPKSATSVTVFFPDAVAAKIQELAEMHGLSFQQAFYAMAIAGLEIFAQKETSFQEKLEMTAPPPFAGATEEQSLFYRNISASLSANRLCMAEASTGVGKSRAMIMAAVGEALKDKKPVVITSPTLAILGHLWSEFEALRREKLTDGVTAGFYPGVSEFVDHEALSAYMAEAETPDPAVVKWIADGGPVIHRTPLVSAMENSGARLRFLMEDLKMIATQLPASAFALTGQKIGKDENLEDLQEGAIYWDPRLDQVRRHATQCDLVFCSHAMLGRAQQTGWSSFPSPKVVFVDEAHQFEQGIASIHMDSFSVYMLRHDLLQFHRNTGTKSSSLSAKAYDAADALLRACRNFDSGEQQIRITSKSAGILPSLIDNLHAALKKPQMQDFPFNAKITGILSQIGICLQKDTGTTYVTFSPDRRYPSLIVGTNSVSGALGALWKVAEGGAVLASATLYTPDAFGAMKCDYMTGVLSLPRSRLDTPPPVVAHWVRDLPTLHVPTHAAAAKLARPMIKSRTENTETQWLEFVSAAVRLATQDAAGGSLVLATSYAMIKEMGRHLAPHTGDRLVLQNPDAKFSVAEQRYREMHKAGVRPILVALGPAWTGVDFLDKDAANGQEDTLLTTLVIACAPIGLNKTTTMIARTERTILPIIQESVLQLRQGMGRLIRSRDAVNRHIWFLDGRPWVEWPHMDPWQKGVRKVLDGYKNRATFDLEDEL